MKTLLLGCCGQVGWELQRSLAALAPVVALGREGRDGLCGDLNDLAQLAATVRQLQPAVIVNAAAYTAVDRAEIEPDLARRINAEAPAVLAREAASYGALLVHYSTDYVFDGSGSRPWDIEDPTGPLNVYGQTKLEGEQAIQASNCAHLILRTSWVYAARGRNFAKTMLRLAREREQLKVIHDQWGAPTGAELIADVTAHAVRQIQARPQDAGTYHLSAAGATTWFDYAQFVIEHVRQSVAASSLAVQQILPVDSAAYPSTAARPHNSRLQTSKLQAVFDLVLPPWQDGVRRMLDELISQAVGW